MKADGCNFGLKNIVAEHHREPLAGVGVFFSPADAALLVPGATRPACALRSGHHVPVAELDAVLCVGHQHARRLDAQETGAVGPQLGLKARGAAAAAQRRRFGAAGSRRQPQSDERHRMVDVEAEDGGARFAARGDAAARRLQVVGAARQLDVDGGRGARRRHRPLAPAAGADAGQHAAPLAGAHHAVQPVHAQLLEGGDVDARETDQLEARVDFAAQLGP